MIISRRKFIASAIAASVAAIGLDVPALFVPTKKYSYLLRTDGQLFLKHLIHQRAERLWQGQW